MRIHGLRRVLVALLALGVLLAVRPALAFTNGQAASLVLGQPNFTSSAWATTAQGLFSPQGVAVDPTTGAVFVADSSNNRVLRFDAAASKPNGAPADGVLGQANFIDNISGTSAQRMHSPAGVAVDASGRLWVVDYWNQRVLRFDGASGKLDGAAADGVLGQPNFTSNVAATTAQGLSEPAGAAVDAGGRLWVADGANRRVLRFDAAASKPNGAAADVVLGQPSFTTSTVATSAQGMSQPRGVAVDAGGRLWVVDAGNRALLFNP